MGERTEFSPQANNTASGRSEGRLCGGMADQGAIDGIDCTPSFRGRMILTENRHPLFRIMR
jgi:hypothetical protein